MLLQSNYSLWRLLFSPHFDKLGEFVKCYRDGICLITGFLVSLFHVCPVKKAVKATLCDTHSRAYIRHKSPGVLPQPAEPASSGDWWWTWQLFVVWCRSCGAVVFFGGALPSDQVKVVLGRVIEAGIIVVYLLKRLKMVSHTSALESLLPCGDLFCSHQWRWAKHACFSIGSSTNSTGKQDWFRDQPACWFGHCVTSDQLCLENMRLMHISIFWSKYLSQWFCLKSF